MNNMNDNKQSMERALAGLSSGDPTAFVELFADDIVWTAKGTTAWSGSYHGKRDVLAVLGAVASRVEGPIRVQTSRLIAAHDFVIVEARGENLLSDGRRYDNEYCWVCRFEGGLLRELVEYMDTDLTKRVLSAEPPVQLPR